MGQRRGTRGVHRTDDQILAHDEDVALLRAISAGGFTTSREYRWALQRLTREDCVLAGFGEGTTPVLLPRGQRIVATANGELPHPIE